VRKAKSVCSSGSARALCEEGQNLTGVGNRVDIGSDRLAQQAKVSYSFAVTAQS
jgi:hypothetical protein